MIPPGLVEELMVDEGLELAAYPDVLTGGAPWTIGYGHTGKDVGPGVVWKEGLAYSTLVGDVHKVVASLMIALPWYTSLNLVRQSVLANMAYNLGVHGLLDFKHMLTYCAAGNYAQAAVEMLDSTWAGQVPERAKRLARQMFNGDRNPNRGLGQ